MGSSQVQFLWFFRTGGNALWTPHRSKRTPEKDIGKLCEELEQELWIWRPILAGKLSFNDIKSGFATVEEILKINALLDMSDDYQAAAMEKDR